jgi:uncharacterized protein YbjT (DUF2867 family)
MGKKIILTGATGMVGEGVLFECLSHPEIDQVLVIGRRPCGISNPKMAEIIHHDFSDISGFQDQFVDSDACFFCAGISSVGKTAEEYYATTYTLTLNFAQTLAGANNKMIFCYISGAGTDSTEKGKLRWARVKGKTENDLMQLPFERVYNFRPAFLKPSKGQKNTLTSYKVLFWLYPILKLISPNSVIALKDVGLAMINAVLIGYEKQILEVKDIPLLAQKTN